MNPDASTPDPALQRARSYDGVAAAYERVSAPLLFDPPARVLVEVASPRSGFRVLDVGSGTGAVARAVLDAVGPAGRVVAVDPSHAMLEAAHRRGVADLAVGSLPRLPFADESFDAVLSAFVLTHVDDPESAARDMRRVLRPEGRIGLSAWGPSDDEYVRAWAGVVHEFVDPACLADAAQRVLPGEDRFSQPDGLRRLLEAAGFAAARTETRVMWFALTVDEMIECREVGASGRALRALLDAEEWSRYQTRARTLLRARFPSGVRYQREIYFATAERGA